MVLLSVTKQGTDIAADQLLDICTGTTCRLMNNLGLSQGRLEFGIKSAFSRT